MEIISNDSSYSLVAVSGSEKGREFILKQGENVIGRNEGEVRLDFDQQVSRRHCCLKVPSQEIVLVDLGSTNGTIVNGEKILPDTPTVIKPGDILQIGDGEYRLVSGKDFFETKPGVQDNIAKKASELGGKFLKGAKDAVDLGGRKAEEAAPLIQKAAAEAQERAQAAAEKTKEQARVGAEQLRMATMTGIKLRVIIAISIVLLLVCMVLPVALGWPMYISVSAINESSESSQGGDGIFMAGSDSESYYEYAGFNYNAVFVPSKLSGDAKFPALITAIIAGPLIITGNSITMAGQANDYDYGGSTSGSLTIGLTSSSIAFWFILSFVLVLVVADLLIGDQWAMQKILIGIAGTWFVYSLTLGFIPQIAVRAMSSGAYDSSVFGLGFDPVRGAPLTIAGIGIVYWVVSTSIKKFILKKA